MKRVLIALLFLSVIGMSSCSDALAEIQVQETPEMATESGNAGGTPDPSDPPPCPTC